MSRVEVEVEGRIYQVVLTIKNIKNSYLRVSDNGEVLISTRRKMSKKDIMKFIGANKTKVDKAINLKLLERERRLVVITLFDKDYQLSFGRGNGYILDKDQLLIKSRSDDHELALEKFKLKFAKEKLPNIFYEVVSDLQLSHEEPDLQIRKMKTRWGVCHVSKNKVVLNSELIKYPYETIRYVIIHELMHFIEPNHSKKFWKLVENFVPDYKRIRQNMK